MTMVTVSICKAFLEHDVTYLSDVELFIPLVQQLQFRELHTEVPLRVCKNIHREMLVSAPFIRERNWK